MKQNKPIQKFAYINTLRGIAVLCVLLVHAGYAFNVKYLPDFFTIIFANGRYGVQLFFFASAFTIFHSYSHRQAEGNVKINFFIRRFFRIAPLYYIAILYYLFQNGFPLDTGVTNNPHIGLFSIIENVFFVHGFDPYYINTIVPGGWSIAVEMCFYCMVPIIFKYIRTINGAVYFLIGTLVIRKLSNVLITNFVLNHIANHELGDSFVYSYLPNQLPVFAIGILYYFIVQNNSKITSAPILILFVLLALELTTKIFSFSPHIFLAASFILLAIGLNIPAKRVVLSSVIQYIGTISYSMYLSHFAILFYFSKLIQLPIPSGCLTNLLYFSLEYLSLLGLTVLVSSITYKYIEVPCQAAGKKLITFLKRDKSPILSPEILPDGQM